MATAERYRATARGTDLTGEVLVLDQDDDPPGRLHEGEFALGRKTFASMKADPELILVPLLSN